MSSSEAFRRRLGAALGVAAPVFAFACILGAVASDPSFSWTNNALSDLGVVHGVAGTLFNFGLYTSGLLALGFSVFGLFTYLKGGLVGKVGAGFFTAAALALVGIGFFNESFHGTHFAFSVAFFVTAPISLFIITCAFALSKRWRMAAFTVAVGLAAGLPWIVLFAYRYVHGVAVPETISALAVSAWAITLSYLMIRKAKN